MDPGVDRVNPYPRVTLYGLDGTADTAVPDLHRGAVGAPAPLGHAPTDYDEPAGGFPHVGLALLLDPERTGAVAGALLDKVAFDWTCTVDGVSVTRLSTAGDGHGLVASVGP